MEDKWTLTVKVKPEFAKNKKQLEHTHVFKHYQHNILEIVAPYIELPKEESDAVDIGGSSENICTIAHNEVTFEDVHTEQELRKMEESDLYDFTCKHFVVMAEIKTINEWESDGKHHKHVSKQNLGFYPRTVTGINEGGYNAVTLCVDCIVETTNKPK